jgi:hypothetical protein
MTDTPPTPPTPEPAAAPGAYAPAAAGPKQTMSIVGFILGIASVIFSWTGILGLAAGIAAVIVSNKAKKAEPGAPSWMHTVGLITGIVGIVLSIILGIVTLISVFLPFILLGSYGYYS